MPRNDEPDEGIDKIDQTESFFSGIFGAIGGIPLFALALIGGYFFGAHERGEIVFGLIWAWVDLLWGWSAFVVIPILAACFHLMLHSEIPRVSIASVVFVTCAWSAFAHDSPRERYQGAAIALVTIVLYAFCIHPLVLDHWRNRR